QKADVPGRDLVRAALEARGPAVAGDAVEFELGAGVDDVGDQATNLHERVRHAEVEAEAVGRARVVQGKRHTGAVLDRGSCTGAPGAAIAPGARVGVVAGRPVGLGRVRADTGRRVARARQVALIERRADDGGPTHAAPDLARVRA